MKVDIANSQMERFSEEWNGRHYTDIQYVRKRFGEMSVFGYYRQAD